MCFNSQPPEGGWVQIPHVQAALLVFQLTAARRRLGDERALANWQIVVSTHSRPKAAGSASSCVNTWSSGFNSQPPEGGWLSQLAKASILCRFNSQPPEGGWVCLIARAINEATFQLTAARRRLVFGSIVRPAFNDVSTHSRPKAAGSVIKRLKRYVKVSTHSRPKAAGFVCHSFTIRRKVSTHSRPKAAGLTLAYSRAGLLFQLTAARRRLGPIGTSTQLRIKFQLTAARRRLVFNSRKTRQQTFGFNSQPPEGGWVRTCVAFCFNWRFNSQPPEGGWFYRID